VKAWIFDPGKVRTRPRCKDKPSPVDVKESPSPLDTSLFNGMFASPYKTPESQTALGFWLRLTKPEAIDCPIANELHSILGAYIPQAAWHLEAVRHSLISAASAALVLEARSSHLDNVLQHSLSKQSIIHMHLAIRGILLEKQASLATALTAIMMSVVCVWMGRLAECKGNLVFCLHLSKEVRARGEHVPDDLFTCAETMVEVLGLLPLSSARMTHKVRIGFAYRVLATARLWVENVMHALEGMPDYGPVLFSLRAYRARMKWILRQWRESGRRGSLVDVLDMKDTPFRKAACHMGLSLLEHRDSPNRFDLRLFTTQMTLALKITALYGAFGDAEKLREAAVACHARVSALSCAD
jgi:hypothetical protein